MAMIITCNGCGTELEELPDEHAPTTLATERQKIRHCSVCQKAQANLVRQPRLFKFDPIPTPAA